MNLQNLASMFSNSSTPLTAADLQKYQSAGLNMANFPSLPSVSTCLHLCICLSLLCHHTCFRLQVTAKPLHAQFLVKRVEQSIEAETVQTDAMLQG